MIRINLLNNVAMGKAGVAAEPSMQPETLRLAVAKAVVVLIFPIALFIYERMNLSEAELNLSSVQQRIQAVAKERAKFGDAAPKIERYNKEKARIDKELEVVSVLARNRLREVKALFAIQSLIPEKAWAKKIAINGNAVKLEGFSSTSEGISDLIRALEGDVFFSKIEPKFTSQETTATGSVKRFELEFRIGRQE